MNKRRIALLAGADDKAHQEIIEWTHEILGSEDFTTMILRAHLVLEQCIELRLREKLQKPEVLAHPKYARLTYAQKLAVLAGLIPLSPEAEEVLSGFNKIRNTVAHDLEPDFEKLLPKALPSAFSDANQIPLDPTNHEDRVMAVRAGLSLALLELDIIRGVRRLDVESPVSS